VYAYSCMRLRYSLNGKNRAFRISCKHPHALTRFGTETGSKVSRCRPLLIQLKPRLRMAIKSHIFQNTLPMLDEALPMLFHRANEGARGTSQGTQSSNVEYPCHLPSTGELRGLWSLLCNLDVCFLFLVPCLRYGSLRYRHYCD
jgi:hypothetical protein